MDQTKILSRLADSYLEHIRIAAEVRDKSAPFRDFLDNWAAFASEANHHRRASNRVIWFNNPDAIKRREMLLSLPFRSEAADTILRQAKENPREYNQRLMDKDKDIRLVVDHTVPISVIVEKLFEQGADLTQEGIRNHLNRLYRLGLLTNSEDAKLRQAGLRSRMPENWDGKDLIARYRVVNFKSVVEHNSP